KVNALEELVSQFYEGGALGSSADIPKDAAGREKRLREVRQAFLDRSLGVAKKYRPQLIEWYGQDRAKFQHAEAFELGEYGSQPKKAELRRLFPFFPEKGKEVSIESEVSAEPLSPISLDETVQLAQGDKGLGKATLAWNLPWDADWVTAVTFLGPTH